MPGNNNEKTEIFEEILKNKPRPERRYFNLSPSPEGYLTRLESSGETLWDERDSNGRTLAAFAIYHEKTDAFKNLYQLFISRLKSKKNVKINNFFDPDSNGLNLIFTAITTGNTEMVKAVLELESDYREKFKKEGFTQSEAENKNPSLPKDNISFSVYCHQKAVLKFLIHREFPSWNNSNNQSQNYYQDICKSKGGKLFIEAINGYLDSPLTNLKSLDGMIDFLKELISNDDANDSYKFLLGEKDNQGNNAFALAIKNSDIKLLKYLYDKFCKISQREEFLIEHANDEGNNGLVLAFSQSNEEVLSFLLDKLEEKYQDKFLVFKIIKNTPHILEKTIQKAADRIILYLSEYFPNFFVKDSKTLELLVKHKRLSIIPLWLEEFIDGADQSELKNIRDGYSNSNDHSDRTGKSTISLLTFMLDLKAKNKKIEELENGQKKLLNDIANLEIENQKYTNKENELHNKLKKSAEKNKNNSIRLQESLTSLDQAKKNALMFKNMNDLLMSDFLKVSNFLSYFIRSKFSQQILDSKVFNILPKAAKQFFQPFIKKELDISLLPYTNLSNRNSLSVYSAQKLLACSQEQEMAQLVKKREISLIELDSAGISVLHAALIKPNLPDFAISTFISEVGDVHKFLEHADEIAKNTTMHIAAMSGILRVFEFVVDRKKLSRSDLFKKMSDQKYCNTSKQTPIQCLIENGNKEILRFIVGREKTNILDEQSLHNLIKISIQFDSLTLFKRTFKLIFRSFHGKKSGKKIKSSKLGKLINECIYNTKKFHDEHPLVLTSISGQNDIFEYLIQINEGFARLKSAVKTSEDKTILHLVCEHGHLELLKTYRNKISHLSNKDQEYFDQLKNKDQYGNTALHYVAKHAKELLVELLRNLKQQQILEVLSIPNSDNATAIHMAIYYQSAEVLEFLLQYGGSLDIQAQSVGGLKGPFDGYQLFFAILTRRSLSVKDQNINAKLHQILTNHQLEKTIQHTLTHFDTKKQGVSAEDWKTFQIAIGKILRSHNNFKANLSLKQPLKETINYAQKISEKLAVELISKYRNTKKVLMNKEQVLLNQTISICVDDIINDILSEDTKNTNTESLQLGINESLLVLQASNEYLKTFYDELLFLLNSSYGVSLHIARGDLEKVTGTLGNEIVIELIAEIIGVAAKLFGEAFKAASFPLMAANPAAGAAVGVVGNTVSNSSGTISTLAKLILNYHDLKVKESFKEKASNYIKSLTGATLNKDILDHKRFHTVVTLLAITFLPMIEKLHNTEEVVRLARFLFSRIFYRFSQNPTESDENISEALSRGLENIRKFFKHKGSIGAPLKTLEKRCLYAALRCPVGEGEKRFYFERKNLKSIYLIGDIINQTTLLVPKHLEKAWEGYNVYAPTDIKEFKKAKLLSENFGSLILEQEIAEKNYDYKLDITLTDIEQGESLVGRFSQLQAPAENMLPAQKTHQFITKTGDSASINNLLMYLAILAQDQKGVGVYLPKDQEAAEIAKKMISVFGFYLLNQPIVPDNFMRDETLSQQYCSLKGQSLPVLVNVSSTDVSLVESQKLGSVSAPQVMQFNIFKNNIVNIVAKYGLRLETVPGDGSCFYHSIAYLLQKNGIKVPGFNGDSKQLHNYLRNMTVDHIEKNLSQYHEFGHNEGESKLNLANRYDRSNLNHLREHKTYAAEGEILALSRLLNISLVIIGDIKTRIIYKRSQTNHVFYLGYEEDRQHYSPLTILDSQKGVSSALEKELYEQHDQYSFGNDILKQYEH